VTDFLLKAFDITLVQEILKHKQQEYALLSTTKEQHLLFRSKLEAFWERDEQERGTAPCALSVLAGVKDNFSTPVSQNCLL